jgi:prepilin-type N-terminal cleavage/methylation domain-containing protein
MFRSLSRKRKFGFTLVEVLVTTVVIGVLAAVVLPALARQTSAADPARTASDLTNIKMGIELFSQNLRPEFPGDLEDLVNNPDAAGSTTDPTLGDLALDGEAYSASVITRWKGPYLAQTLPEGDAESGNTTWRAGAEGRLENALKVCDLAALDSCEDTSPVSPFVTIQLNAMSATEVAALNDIVDGTDESNSSTSGLFRFAVSGSTAYWNGFYYTIPSTQ